MSTSAKVRILVVNADDFGQSVGVNDGILRSYREGILTSASLMVRGPAAVDAVERAGGLPLGLHLDLGEWAFKDCEWFARYERVPVDDAKAVEAEFLFQLNEFRRLTGRAPTHIDSHQHVHMNAPLSAIAKCVAREMSVPLRRCNPRIRYCGRFYGQTGEGQPCPQGITVDALIKLLGEITPGITELACHPGEDNKLDSMYREERFHETNTLCDPRVIDAIESEGIKLCSFSELASQLHE
jgi:chitin disaccharide deacetylase